MNWYEIKNIETIDSPALIVYKEHVLQNIRCLTEMKDIEHLRPHVTEKARQHLSPHRGQFGQAFPNRGCGAMCCRVCAWAQAC